MAEDLSHLPGGVGGHVDLFVFAVVAAGETDEFVDSALIHFARRGSQSLPDWDRMIAELVRTSLPLPLWLIWPMGAMPAPPRKPSPHETPRPATQIRRDWNGTPS
jgi:hypothetical protein